jgi:hypothetical protein
MKIRRVFHFTLAFHFSRHCSRQDSGSRQFLGPILQEDFSLLGGQARP